MSELVVHGLTILFLTVVALTLVGAGAWLFLVTGLVLGAVGPFLGVLLLGYTGYYTWSLLTVD
ncbi:hypothetical protein [Haloarcula onubensis]|uniref:Uncharacterized protein n=1 Tax=Haloarcula onubensis TaxID=2950539 RepID=A0ABU2FL59_9EURY|nr:hypothetical protein [Halomicroarcula sp. S3CR25-11]MDS0281042.1 hypothetical protein [Halomicroarcula sp. S3CR25-11]